MRVLVIETATSACSVALIEDGAVIASDAALVGRGHAERLLPMIAALPDGGRADAIWVDCGPGSFTGIRVGIAAARALGFGWGAPVQGFSSLALIAASWFAANDSDGVTVVIEGGHGEVFVQDFARTPLVATSPLQSLPREQADDLAAPLVGNVVGDAGIPEASNAVLLAAADLPVRPIYGRGPDAKPMAA
jgi:tRNA threonylcarbamoyladenosine biosynthesis protein TsaB